MIGKYQKKKLILLGICKRFCVNGYTTRRSEYGLFKTASG
jgi:hypothetical protein